MDVQYRISKSGVVSSSVELKGVPEIFATKAKGSCGVDPGPLAI